MHFGRDVRNDSLTVSYTHLIDRAKHTILPLSKFGLMQITRQRVRPEMTVDTMEVCPVCHGTGKAEAAILIIDKIEDQLEYIAREKKCKNIVLKVHPFVGAYLKKGFFSLRLKWAFRYRISLKVIDVPPYYIYEYHFYNQYKRCLLYTSEWLTMYRTDLREGGLRRLMQQGKKVMADYDYLYTQTGVDQASIYTGVLPVEHGIISHDWYDRLRKRRENNVKTRDFSEIGGSFAAGYAPVQLQAMTLGCAMKKENIFSKVYSIAMNPEDAVLSGGTCRCV